ncbi:hypothetical protein M885DRAFT_613938 [Pelagophyceae sp. CCMP2097]|nr:hypothetical protein M885DRAFT_613938 [Pelagophyceae sp. CCMP2097]
MDRTKVFDDDPLMAGSDSQPRTALLKPVAAGGPTLVRIDVGKLKAPQATPAAAARPAPAFATREGMNSDDVRLGLGGLGAALPAPPQRPARAPVNAEMATSVLDDDEDEDDDLFGARNDAPASTPAAPAGDVDRFRTHARGEDYGDLHVGQVLEYEDVSGQHDLFGASAVAQARFKHAQRSAVEESLDEDDVLATLEGAALADAPARPTAATAPPLPPPAAVDVPDDFDFASYIASSSAPTGGLFD